MSIIALIGVVLLVTGILIIAHVIAGSMILGIIVAIVGVAFALWGAGPTLFHRQ